MTKRCLLVVLLIIATSISCVQNRRRPEPYGSSDYLRTVLYWKDCLAQTAFTGRARNELTQILRGNIQDSGYVAWGGSGRQTHYYLMRGGMVISVDIDLDEIIISEPSVGSMKTWPDKEADGRFGIGPDIIWL